MAQVQQPLDGRIGAGMKRQATWDALPDIDLFSIPVDDFFGDYVEELGARGLQQDTAMNGGAFEPAMQHFPHNGTQQMNGLLPPIPAGGVESVDYVGSVPGFHEPDLAALNGMSTLEPLQEDGMMGNIITSGFDTATNQRHNNSGSQQGSGNFGAAGQEVGRVGSNNSAHEHHSQDESPDGDDTGSPLFRNGSGSKRANANKTKRNARQQDQNKQAQQRYRERRKAKFSEMEESLHALASQVEQMGNVQHQNNTLQGKQMELETRLRDKESEVEQLRRALAKAGIKQEEVPVHFDGGGDYDVIKPSECNNYRAHKEMRQKEELATLQAEFTARREELRALVDQHNLREANPLGEGVAPEVIERVKATMVACSQQCLNAMRKEGIKVLALLSQDVDAIDKIQCSVQTARWRRILEMLRLAPPQEEQLLLVRKKHLRNLRELYNDRQRMNLQAMSLMLPKNVSRRLPDDNTLESRMNCLKVTSSYSCAAANNVELDKILDDIKCNLKKEQRIVLELNWHVLYKVLAPIQASIMTVEAFPGHADGLALVNILAMKVGGPQAEAFGDQDRTSSEDKSETCCE